MEIHQHTNASKDVLQIQTISQTLFLKNVCLSANKAITPKIIPGAVYLNAFGTIQIMLIMKLEDVLKNVQWANWLGVITKPNNVFTNALKLPPRMLTTSLKHVSWFATTFQMEAMLIIIRESVFQNALMALTQISQQDTVLDTVLLIGMD